MVQSIVLPHDPAQSPRLGELADAGDFQAAVDGWLEPIEMPAFGITFYVNEAARREHHPINCRAMAIWWLSSVTTRDYPMFLGDVVLTGSGVDEASEDVPEHIIRDVFESREFVLQLRPDQHHTWHDTYARFGSIFDAGVWCALLSCTVRPSVLLRLRSRLPAVVATNEASRGSDALW